MPFIISLFEAYMDVIRKIIGTYFYQNILETQDDIEIVVQQIKIYKENDFSNKSYMDFSYLFEDLENG